MKDPIDTIRNNAVDSPAAIDRLLKLEIPDLAPVYGGVRGRTMSSLHQRYAWPVIKECGIHTIIDLRADGSTTRLAPLCEKYGIEYFYYPIDKKKQYIGETVEKFPAFCEKIDAGNFYIACAMGLHRTDIALCCYWIFHGADTGLPPPEIRGYTKSSGHDVDNIMRVINAFYKCLSEKEGRPPFPLETLRLRKKVITERADC